MKPLQLLSGSVVVYALVACGSAVTDHDINLMDAMTDPVTEAAAANPPMVATEQCSHQYSTGGATATYAEHAFPGLHVQDLIAVSAAGHFASTQNYLSNYTDQKATVLLRDGFAAVQCGTLPGPTFDSVTFVLPQ